LKGMAHAVRSIDGGKQHGPEKDIYLKF
jgi:hypothetical protein